MPSLNFRDWTWVREKQGVIQDPYALLNPLFFDPEVQAAVTVCRNGGSDEAESFVANGGAAIIAYDELQQATLLAAERTRIETELKRYRELDTLAMVMMFQALTEESQGSG